MINEKYAQSMLVEFDGCDSDRPGSPESRAIWLFGIEPGDSIADKLTRTKTASQAGLDGPVDNSYSIEKQMKWSFNQKAFKLLAAIEGETDYKAFARDRQPFVKGSEGYFKGNIYPCACHNVGEWTPESVDEVGCSKETYRQWCNENRIPVIHSWVKKYRPKMFIGVGVSYRNVFSRAVFGREVELEAVQIPGKSQVKTIYSHVENENRLVVMPHFSGPYGMNCNKSIQGAGQFIADLISKA